MILRGNQNPYLKGKAPKKHIDWVVREQPNPLGHLDPAAFAEAARLIGEEASKAFGQELQKLTEFTASYNPFQLLAHFAYYDQIWFDNVEDSHGYKPTTQSAAELLQALVLRVPEPQVRMLQDKTPSPETRLAVNESLRLAQQNYGMMRIGRKPDAKDAAFAAELVRVQTSGVRNEGYPSQIKRLHEEIFRPLDATFRAREGLSLSELLAALWGLVDLISKRFHANFRLRREIIGQPTADKVIAAFAKHVGQPAERVRTDMAEFAHDRRKVGLAVMHWMDDRNSRLFYFEAADVRTLFPPSVSDDVVRSILARLGIGWGELANTHPEHLILNNPVWTRPFIAVGNDHYFFPVIGLVQSFGVEIAEGLLRAHPDLWKRYCDTIRGDFLERRTEEAVRKAFPTAQVFRGLKWTSAEGDGESDVLVLLDSHALIFECKSGQMRARAQRGDTAALREELGKLIGEASRQGKRFADYLLQAKAILRLQDREGVEHAVDVTRLLRATTVNVLLDYLGPINAQHDMLRKAGLIDADVAPTATMALHELESVLEILDRPAIAFHYFRRRAEVESSNRMITDELGFLALYLATAFDLGDLEGDQQRSFMLPTMADELNPYFMGKELGTHVVKPRLRLRPWWSDLLKKFEEKRFFGWMEASYALLCAGYQRHEEFDANCRKLVREVRTNWHREHYNARVMVPGAPGRKLAIICVALKNRTHYQAMAVVNECIVRAEKEHGAQRTLIIRLSAAQRIYPYAGVYFHAPELQGLSRGGSLQELVPEDTAAASDTE